MHANGEPWVIFEIDGRKLSEQYMRPDDYDFPDLWEPEHPNENWAHQTWQTSLKVSCQIAYLADIPPAAIKVHPYKNPAADTQAQKDTTQKQFLESHTVKQIAEHFGITPEAAAKAKSQGKVTARAKAAELTEHPDYYMTEGCGIFAVDYARKNGGEIFVMAADRGESWSDEIPYEVTHAFVKNNGKTFDIRGERTPDKMAWELSMGDYTIKGPWTPEAFEAKFMGSTDDKPLFGNVAAKVADQIIDVGEGDEYWAGEGNAASGILPVCPQKGTVCLAWRSQYVMGPNCWGTIGGAVMAGKSPQESAKAELKEEMGYSGGVTLIPAFVFTDRAFSYHNYIGVVSNQFGMAPKPYTLEQIDHLDEMNAPDHQYNPGWETDHIVWVPYAEAVQDMQENSGDYHPGLLKLFANSKDAIERALKIEPEAKTAAENPALVAFMKDLWAQTTGNPFNNRERVWKEKAIIEARPFSGNIHLSFIRSVERGEGQGSEGLKFLTGLADKHGVKIDLDAKPVGKGLNKGNLVSWYKRHGFNSVKGDDPSHLIYEPTKALKLGPKMKEIPMKHAWTEIAIEENDPKAEEPLKGNLLGGILESDADLKAWAEHELDLPPKREKQRLNFVKKFHGKRMAVIDDMRVFDRGEGWGTKIVNNFIEQAKAANCDGIILQAGIFEKQQKGFDLVDWYGRLGFKTLGHSGELPLMVKWLKAQGKTSAFQSWMKPWLTGGCWQFAIALSHRMPDASFVGLAYESGVIHHVGLEKGDTYYDVRGAMDEAEFNYGTDQGDTIVPMTYEQVLTEGEFGSWIGHEDEFNNTEEMKDATKAVNKAFGKQAALGVEYAQKLGLWFTEASEDKEADWKSKYVLPTALALGLGAPSMEPTTYKPPAPISAPAVTEKQVTIDELIDAIRRTEGADPDLHNPGNLVGFHSGQIMQFENDAQGEHALKNALKRIADGKNPNFAADVTLEDAGKIYANGDPNWAKNVSKILSVDPKTSFVGLIKGKAKVAWAKRAAGFAFKSFKKLWHIGSMNVKDKREGSLEGIGLSVSVNPEEWAQIAEIGGDFWELTKPGNKFLNFHRLSKPQRQQIMTWGIQNGYAEEISNTWRFVYFDSEADEERYMEFTTQQEAQEQLDEQGEGGEVVPVHSRGIVGTARLGQRTKNSRGASDIGMAFDLVVTVYAEDELDCDGVWWADTFVPASLSAPRGVIFPSKLSSWKVLNTSKPAAMAVKQNS